MARLSTIITRIKVDGFGADQSLEPPLMPKALSRAMEPSRESGQSMVWMG
jgi:hypothetical protein